MAGDVRPEVATNAPERVRVMSRASVRNRALEELERGIPEYVANTTYEEIHQATFTMVIEGNCPTCRGRLGLAGWCTTCKHAWTAAKAGATTEITLETRASVILWTLEERHVR